MKLAARVSIAGLLLSSPLLSACAGGPAVSCTGQANNVHHSKGTPSSMDGKATGTCNAPVAISGYVEIQQKTSSGWHSIKRSTFGFVATPDKKFTRMAATKCRKGRFRTYSYVVGTYKGVSETRRSTSGETVNPCS